MFLGTDIVEIDRIRSILQRKKKQFLKHVYTIEEVNYCYKKRNPSLHLSGKFAAKEAVKKAVLSSGSIDSIILKNINIKNSKLGIPFVEIYNFPHNIGRIIISISHTDKYATSTAIFFKNDPNFI